MGEKRNVYKLLVERPEGKTTRWIDNIKTNLLETGFGGWAGLVWPWIGTVGELLCIR
jgi:hypothetical protein